MIAVNLADYGDLEKVGFAKESPAKKLPVIESASVEDSQLPGGSEQGDNIAEARGGASGGFVISYQGLDGSVVVTRGIYSVYDFFIACDEKVGVHFGGEIYREIGVVTEGVEEEPALGVEALVESGAAWGVEEADHGDGYAGGLDEGDEAFENGGAVAVEAEDKARVNLHSGVLDFFNAGDEVAAEVLRLAALGEAFFVGRLYADEDGVEAGGDHQGHQLFVVGKIDGDLGGKREGV